MNRSFLAAVRNAVTPDAASQSQSPSTADSASAIETARAEGAAAATARFLAIMADDRLKADPTLMAAAIDLAAKSDMDGPDIVAFVSSNVTAPSTRPSAGLAARIAEIEGDGDPLGAAYGGGLPPAAADGWSEAFASIGGKGGSK